EATKVIHVYHKCKKLSSKIVVPNTKAQLFCDSAALSGATRGDGVATHWSGDISGGDFGWSMSSQGAVEVVAVSFASGNDVSFGVDGLASCRIRRTSSPSRHVESRPSPISCPSLAVMDTVAESSFCMESIFATLVFFPSLLTSMISSPTWIVAGDILRIATLPEW